MHHIASPFNKLFDPLSKFIMTQIDRGVKFSASEVIARRIAAVAAGYIADQARHQCKQILMHYAAGIESFDLQSLLRLMV